MADDEIGIRETVDERTVAAVGRLTTQLVNRSSTPDANLACSGLGLWSVLAVLASGASGATGEELEALVGVPGTEVGAVAGALDAHVAQLGCTDHAVAIWTRVPTYRAWRATLPFVGAFSLDDPVDLDGWVRDHTNGMIDRFPVAVDDETLLALADALCLDAVWARPFLPEHTRPRAFRVASGTTDVPTMVGEFSALDAGSAGSTTVVDLDTRPVGSVVMRLGLGVEGASPGEVVADVLAGAPANRRPLDAARVRLFVPRFKLRSDLDLGPFLAAEGAARCLTDLAEFPRLSPERLKVDEIAQAVVVSVTEQGVKAAAVTSARMGIVRAAATSRPIELHLDRPFAFALIATESQMPLFAGWVADPAGM